jgi:hypothetical protein
MGASSRRRVSAVAIIRRVIVVVVVEAATIDVVASRSVCCGRRGFCGCGLSLWCIVTQFPLARLLCVCSLPPRRN